MAFRTVIISTHCKLEYSLNYLVYKTIDETKRINLDEIHTVIIESTAVSITSALMVELIEKKIKVIFCDLKHNPSFELVPYYGDSITTRRINEQLSWRQEIKDLVWKRIVKDKIQKQAYNIYDISIKEQLLKYMEEVEKGDVTNREGHAAKIYFNNVFGKGFVRNSDNEINIYLNYGYSILLSQINRVIVSKGYLTQVGIHHKNDFNQFNLSCDLIEPFRPLVDATAKQVNKENYKEIMVNMLHKRIKIGGEYQLLVNAITIYCTSVFRALNTENIDEIVDIERYEL